MSNTILTQLAQPFAPRFISFKPGATTKDGSRCMALTYCDLRACMERLDEVCGLDWSVQYEPWGDGRIIAKLTINGVTRSSTGEADAQDAKNGLAGSVTEAMAFKRAAAMFGLGRYLYDLPCQWVEFDAQRRCISETGQKQLMEQYRSWYERQVAGSVDDHIDQVGEQERVEDNLLSPVQLARLHALGMEFYGSKVEWDAKRPQLVKAASNGVTTSSKALTRDQAQLLIDGMQKRLSERERHPVPA